MQDLSDESYLDELKAKWWKEKLYRERCRGVEYLDEGAALSELAGIFYVVIAGIVVTFFILVCEYYWLTRAKQHQNQAI